MFINSVAQFVGKIRHPQPALAGEAGITQPNSQTQRGKSGGWCHLALALCVAIGLILLVAPRAEASFVDLYAISKFTLTDVDIAPQANTHGQAMSPDGGLSLVFTGSSSGTGLEGFTDLLIHAAVAGLVHFQYSYSTDDSFFPPPAYAGYLLGGVFVQLSDTDGVCNGAACPGTVDFAVAAGENFGFRIGTDNQGPLKTLTVFDFSAPIPSAAIPEPGTLPGILLLAAAATTARSWIRRRGRG
jgi:hypothetical protein